jgi:hypothetical protein
MAALGWKETKVDIISVIGQVVGSFSECCAVLVSGTTQPLSQHYCFCPSEAAPKSRAALKEVAAFLDKHLYR